MNGWLLASGKCNLYSEQVFLTIFYIIFCLLNVCKYLSATYQVRNIKVVIHSFDWCVGTFDFAICLGTFRLEFSSELIIFVILLFYKNFAAYIIRRCGIIVNETTLQTDQMTHN